MSPTPSYACIWLWDSITVLCDGNVTCGLEDPLGTRSFGNLKSSSLMEIFSSAAVNQLRIQLLSGNSGVPCSTCKLYHQIDESTVDALASSFPYPKRLVLETTIRCNIRCPNPTCNVTNDKKFRFREETYMSWPLFCELIDEVGPYLEEIRFYNYGEPFLHPRAIDMLEYIRRTNPSVRIITSTNGLLLSKGDKARRIVENGLLDWICFTIAGCDEETYQRYHPGGTFAEAIRGMKALVDEKIRTGKSRPTVHWRYLASYVLKAEQKESNTFRPPPVAG